MPTLFQVGAIIGILQGVKDGDVDFKTLIQHGDTGIGMLNGMDDEMIAVENDFYRLRTSTGKAELINPDAYTPFTVVAKFKHTHSFYVSNVGSLNELNLMIDQHIDTVNVFYMMRIDAELESVKLSSRECPMRTHKNQIENVVPAPDRELKDLTGTLIVTRNPAFSAAFTITGYHHHFIDHARTTGGHVSSLKIRSGKVMITPIRRFSMVLAHNKAFDQADLKMY
jgi:acetolactate decarboxylase